MPRAAAICAVPGCPNVAVEGGRCLEHKRDEQHDYNVQRGSAASQGYDAAWRRIRAEFLAAHSRCIDCGAAATEADHVLPLKRGGTHDWGNLRARCKRCHSRRTAREGGRWAPRGEGAANR